MTTAKISIYEKLENTLASCVSNHQIMMVRDMGYRALQMGLITKEVWIELKALSFAKYDELASNE